MNLLPGENFDVNKLVTPPLDCQVTYSWLWNVPVTKEKIDYCIEVAKRAGMKSLYVICMPKDFRPETMRTFLEPEYLTPEFFELIDYATRKCVENGIMPWLYDEGGWPSGAACGRTVLEYPEAKTNMLKKRSVTLKAGESLTKSDRHIALFDGKTRLPDGYVAEGEVRLTEYFGGPDEITPHFLDYTDKKMTEVFLGNTYEPYKRLFGDLFGHTIPLMFTDEPGLKRGILPKRLFELFREKYGYDLLDYVYVIEGGGELAEDEKEIRARIDYLRLVGEMFYRNTFEPISRWCEENGIAYSGHLMADNYPEAGERQGYYSIMRVMRLFAIPGIDVIWEQIRYPYGGREPYDEVETARMPFYPRIAPSAARQRGRNLALTESIGIYGDGITPDEIRYVTNYQVVRGINVISYYHLPISNTRYSALATRPNFRPEKPGFYNLAHINEYVARITYLARLGYAEGDTALYHATEDHCGNQKLSDAATESYKNAGIELERQNIAFDIIDDFGIMEAVDTGDGLKLGDAIYRHIVLPECKYIPDEVRERIAPYLGAGEPTYRFNNPYLRVMTRRLDGGRLWFIFNEGEAVVNEAFELSGGKNIYKIDLTNGRLANYGGESCDLLCGEIAVFLATDSEYATVVDEVEYSVTAGELTPVGHKRFIVGYDYLYNEYGDGNVTVDGGFSGDITYKASYTLPKAPECGERYRLRLEGFSLTAAVELGGERISFGLSPMERIIDGRLLERSGELAVTVSNSSLNEIKCTEGLMNHLPKAELGPYIDRLKVHEERVPAFKVGRIVIEKLID